MPRRSRRSLRSWIRVRFHTIRLFLSTNPRVRRFREQLAKVLLDIAESLPTTKRGPIHDLQTLRARQRKLAEKTQAAERPTEGSSSAVTGFLLLELFELEKLGSLKRAIGKLFPYHESAYEAIKTISARSESLLYWEHHPLGIVVGPDRRGVFSPFATSIDPTIPSEFSEVEIALTRVLPSFYAITFRFSLSDIARAQIDQLQRTQRLSRVVFHDIFRMGLRGWSERTEGSLVPIEVSRLRRSASRWVASYAHGIFHATRRWKDRGLPAVDLIELIGFPSDEASVSGWIQQSHRWLQSYAISLEDTLVFRKDRRVLQLHRFSWDAEYLPPAFLSLDRDDFHGPRELAPFLAASLAISNYIDAIRDRLESRRSELFERLHHPFARLRRSDLRAISDLDELLFATRRLETEIGHPGNLGATFDHVDGFLGMRGKLKDQSFTSMLREDYRRGPELLKEYMAMIRDALSGQVEVANLWQMNRLQWLVAILTVVLTCLSLIPIWRALKRMTAVAG